MEINQFDILLNRGKEENVLRFQIHVDKLVFVQVGNCTKYLSDNLRCILLCQEHSTVNIFINLTKQVATLAKLRHYEETLFVLKDFLESQNIRVIQVLQ